LDVRRATRSVPTNGLILARYNPDGSLDTGFGPNGTGTTNAGLSSSQALAVALQPDGKIIAAGSAQEPGLASQDFALARFNPDGSLDTGFGSGGTVITGVAGVNEGAHALVLQPDGKIIVAGAAGSSSALARYNPDGSLDAGFGSGGIVTTAFAGPSSANAVALQPDGMIVTAGTVFVGLGDFALARYNPDGTLDPGFGAGGQATTDFAGGDDAAFAVLLQPDGRVVAGGVSAGDFALARYDSMGSLDKSFGKNGTTTTHFGAAVKKGKPKPVFFPSTAGIRALAFQPDGRFVAAGFFNIDAEVGRMGHFALARYFE